VTGNAVTIEFYLAQPAHGELSVVDLNGKTLHLIGSGNFSGGAHRYYWNSKQGNGNKSNTGVYFIRLLTNAGFAQQKLIITD
jgi:flagellar hook assembly protein FlgD